VDPPAALSFNDAGQVEEWSAVLSEVDHES
jgi:hypothetical protein